MYLFPLTILFIAFAILAWRNLKMALVLLSGLLPIYLLRFDVGPIPSTALEVLILICVIIWAYRLSRPNTRKNLLKKTSRLARGGGTVWIQPTLLLIAAASFGAVVAPDLFSALGIWKAYFIEPILVATMMITTFNRNDWIRSLQALSLSAIVISIFAIVQYLTGIGIPTPWDIELRVTSFFDYPNALGLFLAPIVSLNAILLFLHPERSRGISRILPILTILLGVIAIILGQTEAALVAIPAAVVIALLFSSIKRKTKYVLLALSVLLVLFSLLIPTSREKLLLQDYSGQVRISQWTEMIELLKDKPFFGAGLNGYPEALEPYHDATLYEIFQYPHNIFLNTWTELGLIGLIVLIWFGILIIRSFVIPDSDRGSIDYRNPIKLALFAALLTIFIHGLVDVPYFKNDLAVMTWVLLAGFITTNYKQKISN